MEQEQEVQATQSSSIAQQPAPAPAPAPAPKKSGWANVVKGQKAGGGSTVTDSADGAAAAAKGEAKSDPDTSNARQPVKSSHGRRGESQDGKHADAHHSNKHGKQGKEKEVAAPQHPNKSGSGVANSQEGGSSSVGGGSGGGGDKTANAATRDAPTVSIHGSPLYFFLTLLGRLCMWLALPPCVLHCHTACHTTLITAFAAEYEIVLSIAGTGNPGDSKGSSQANQARLEKGVLSRS